MGAGQGEAQRDGTVQGTCLIASVRIICDRLCPQTHLQLLIWNLPCSC